MGLFDNQTAIVTGAGVGIGYEISHQLSLQGAAVILNDIDEALAKDAATHIGGNCYGTGGDVSSVAVVRGLVDMAVEKFGRLDMVVCNAGLTTWGDFFEYEPEKFDRVMGVNLRGTYFLAQAAARQMRKQGSGGRIVLMSSVTGHQSVRYLSAYSMTKAALEMLAKNLVVELSPYKITINAVAPGPTVTPRNLQDDPNYAEIWGAFTPLQEPAWPIDIANAVVFFLSPQASHITGQTLVVDGGWSAISPTPALEHVEEKHT